MAGCCQMTDTSQSQSQCQSQTAAGGQVQAHTGKTQYGPTYRPTVDVYEKAEEFVVVADVPGARSEQVDIHVEDGVLTLRASVTPRRPESARGLLCEYGIGDYVREFRLGEAIDTTRISAEMRNGVLTVRLPKVEAAKPRKIQVAIK